VRQCDSKKTHHGSRITDHESNIGCVPIFPIVNVSALKGDGLDELKNAIHSLCISSGDRCSPEGMLITNIRHRHCIEKAAISLGVAIEDFENDEPLEIIAISLRESLDSLSEIIGAVSTEDILNKIFSEFCIGK